MCASVTTVTNRLNVETMEQPQMDEQIFARNLSPKCYNVVEEAKQNTIVISVSKVIDEQNQSFNIQRFNLELEPLPKAFQVLSLDKVATTESTGALGSLFLNIAFKVGYNEKSSKPIKYDDPLATIPQRTVQLATNVKPDLITIDEEKNEYIDKNVRWKLFSSGPTSFRAFTAKMPPEYSLPSMAELKNFFTKVAFQENNGNSVFTKLFRFNGESAVFASSDQFFNDGTQKIKCLRIFKAGFIQQQEDFEDIDSIYFIILSKK